MKRNQNQIRLLPPGLQTFSHANFGQGAVGDIVHRRIVQTGTDIAVQAFEHQVARQTACTDDTHRQVDDFYSRIRCQRLDGSELWP
jgi:hypothetical protein